MRGRAAMVAAICALAPGLSARAEQAQTGQGSAAADKATPPAPEEHLSPQERQTRSHRSLERMKELTGQVERLTGQARDEKDIVKLNCVNEKLNQVRGLLRISEQSEADQRESDARREDDPAAHAASKIAIAMRKVNQLRQDAEQCIGQLAYYNDEKTLVDVEIPAGLPANDPTYTQVPPGVENRPAPASGF